jgi:hypothetical protein
MPQGRQETLPGAGVVGGFFQGRGPFAARLASDSPRATSRRRRWPSFNGVDVGDVTVTAAFKGARWPELIRASGSWANVSVSEEAAFDEPYNVPNEPRADSDMIARAVRRVGSIC